jgi:hypothetical protein
LRGACLCGLGAELESTRLGNFLRSRIFSQLRADLEAGSHHTQGVVLGLRLAEVSCGRGVCIY